MPPAISMATLPSSLTTRRPVRQHIRGYWRLEGSGEGRRGWRWERRRGEGDGGASREEREGPTQAEGPQPSLTHANKTTLTGGTSTQNAPELRDPRYISSLRGLLITQFNYF